MIEAPLWFVLTDMVDAEHPGLLDYITEPGGPWKTVTIQAPELGRIFVKWTPGPSTYPPQKPEETA